jgi:fatty acid synthase subunit beta
MTIETINDDGTTDIKPILKGLTADSRSYTFSDDRGLVFSTQFAQPAILLLENAIFEDMRTAGLVQDGASFAGHSLGEYGCLSAVAGFMPLEKLMDVVFYRGLTMQVAMDRDGAGRTDYAMVAVSPRRVGLCKCILLGKQSTHC